MAYPITYELPYQERRSRLLAFFRLLLAVPWTVVGVAYLLAACVTVPIAWFALVFTAHYPPGLYRFNAGLARFFGRLYSWYYLLTDRWPPFGLAEQADFPGAIEIPPPQEVYSRPKVGLRAIIGFPTFALNYVFGAYLSILGFIAWFAVVFTGKLSRGLYDQIVLSMRYLTRSYGYFYLLLSDRQPPISDSSAAPRDALEAGHPDAIGRPTEAATAAPPDPFPEGPNKVG